MFVSHKKKKSELKKNLPTAQETSEFKKNLPEGPRDVVDVSRAHFLLLLVLWFGSGVGIRRFEATPIPCEQLLVAVVWVQVCRPPLWFEGRCAVTKYIEPV